MIILLWTFAILLGVKLAYEKSKYLGLPSWIGRSKKDIFAFLKDRLWQKVNGWKQKFLSSEEWNYAFMASVES